MSTALIGFSRPKKFKLGSEAIKLWMNTPYSHVYLRVYSQYTKQWLVYQASHGMVNCLTYDNFRANNVVVREFALNIEPEKQRFCIRRAQQLLGKPYGYLGLAKLVLREFGLPLPGDGDKSFHCSEFIVALFPEILDDYPQDFIEPRHLMTVLEARYE